MSSSIMTNRRSRRSVGYSANRARKARVRELISEGSLEELAVWAAEDPQVLRPLIGLVFDPDELICWRTIHVLGLIAPRVFADKPERIRLIIRQQFWHMNDESGNIGWYAPQVIGEMVANVPTLVNEYAHRLPAFFVEEPFEKGAYWAVARISEQSPVVFRPFIPNLIKGCADEDPDIRYHSLTALNRVDPTTVEDAARRLADDDAEVRLYDRDRKDFSKATIADLAADILGNRSR